MSKHARSPAVSVLMPVRNCASYVGAAVESLAGQTLVDLEIIVVDNGSRDGTRAILDRWADRDGRITILSHERAGLSRCLNAAAQAARAPLLARLDGDDIAHPDRLALQVAAFAARPGLLAIGSAVELMDEEGKVLGHIRPPAAHADILAYHRTSCGIIATSSVVRRDAFLAVGGYREGLNLSEDYDLWARIMEKGEVANLSDTLVRYRVHDQSVTSRKPVRMVLSALCVTAAAEARRRHLAEPFTHGTPNLRQALSLLGMSRRQARRLIRLRAMGSRASRMISRNRDRPILGWVVKAVQRLHLPELYRKWLKSKLS